jgi:hypothetical protein
MKIKRKYAGALAGALVALSAPAAASALTLVIPFGNTPGAGSGKFTDVYTFNFPMAGKATVVLGSTQSGPGTNVNFATNSVRFNNVILSVVSSGAVELQQLVNQPVVAGAQTLSIKGFAQALGSYTGTVTFASAPEPATWGMMILGLGAVGYAMRRRRVSVKFATAAA